MTSFEKLEVTMSFGDSDIQSMSPLFEALNDQEKFIPSDNVAEQVGKLVSNLEQLKLSSESSKAEELRIQIKKSIDRLNVEHNFSIHELSFLLDYAGLLRIVGNKMNKLEPQVLP